MTKNRSQMLVGLRQRLAAALHRASAMVAARKGATLTGEAGWRPLSGGRFGAFYAGSGRDWQREAGNLWDNPTIAICLGYLFDKVVEPYLEVAAPADGGEMAPAPDHPLAALLAEPNPEYSGDVLTQALALSYKLDGNAYAIIARGMNGVGPARELWYVPHGEMEPLAPPDGGPTQFYKRNVGGKTELYPRADVLHFRFGMDPACPRKGFSRFRALLREVVTDGEIATFTATILRNLGIVGYLVSPASENGEFEDGQPEELKRLLSGAITGDERAQVVVPSIPIKVEKVGHSPRDMAVEQMGQRPETRICAAFGFPPAALGLGEGGEAQKYGAYTKEAREAAYENGIIPLLAAIAKEVQRKLLPEMGRPGEVVRYNHTAVRDLAPDLDASHGRARDNFVKGIWRLNEARLATGQREDPATDGYFWQLAPKRPSSEAGDDPAPADQNEEG